MRRVLSIVVVAKNIGGASIFCGSSAMQN